MEPLFCCVAIEVGCRCSCGVPSGCCDGTAVARAAGGVVSAVLGFEDGCCDMDMVGATEAGALGLELELQGGCCSESPLLISATAAVAPGIAPDVFDSGSDAMAGGGAITGSTSVLVGICSGIC